VPWLEHEGRRDVGELGPRLCESAEADRDGLPLTGGSGAQGLGDVDPALAILPAPQREGDRFARRLLDQEVDGERHVPFAAAVRSMA
jgi:hypothetical protein